MKKRIVTSRDSGVQADTDLHSYTPSIDDPASKPTVARAKPVVPFSKRRGVNPPKGGKDSPTSTEKVSKSRPWQESTLAKTMERSHGLVLNKPVAAASGQTKNADSTRVKRRDQHHDSTHHSPRRKNEDSSQRDTPVHGSTNTNQDQNKTSSSAAQFYLSHSRYTPLTASKTVIDSHHDRVGFGSRAPRFSQEVPLAKRSGPIKKGDMGAFGSHLPAVVGRSPKHKTKPENAMFGHKTVASVPAG